MTDPNHNDLDIKDRENDTIEARDDKSAEAKESAQEKVEVEKLRKEIEEIRKLNDEYLAGWKRAKADYLNLEAQSGKRLSNILERELADAFLRFLSVYEMFVKAMEHFAENYEGTRKGVAAAVSEFWKTFKDMGVERIECSGKVNPDWHDVLGRQRQEGVEEGMIVQEVAAGYTLKGKLLKPAKVIVAE